MKALPQAIAGASFHSGIMAGKLNGVMPATTPSGWRIEYMSMPGPAPSEKSPFMRCGMPVQNSTTSTPRWMSPLASGDGLAVLAGEQFGERVVLLGDEVEELHHDAGPALRVGGGPGRLRRLGVLDRLAKLALRGERHACR